MNGLDIRQVGPDHAAVLGALHDAIFSGQGDEIWDGAAMAEIMAMPGSFALLAVADGQPVGLAIGRSAADEAELLTFGVAPPARRQGAGKDLLRAFFQAAAQTGALRLFLEVRADNAPALALYHGLGLPVVGRRRDYYRNRAGTTTDALVITGDLPLLIQL